MSAVRPMLERTYAAFKARDVDAVLAAMHPDVDWPNGVKTRSSTSTRCGTG
jgi:hypothetical protein